MCYSCSSLCGALQVRRLLVDWICEVGEECKLANSTMQSAVCCIPALVIQLSCVAYQLSEKVSAMCGATGRTTFVRQNITPKHLRYSGCAGGIIGPIFAKYGCTSKPVSAGGDGMLPDCRYVATCASVLVAVVSITSEWPKVQCTFTLSKCSAIVLSHACVRVDRDAVVCEPHTTPWTHIAPACSQVRGSRREGTHSGRHQPICESCVLSKDGSSDGGACTDAVRTPRASCRHTSENESGVLLQTRSCTISTIPISVPCSLNWALTVVTPSHFLGYFHGRGVLFHNDSMAYKPLIAKVPRYLKKYMDFFADLALQGKCTLQLCPL